MSHHEEDASYFDTKHEKNIMMASEYILHSII